MKYVLLGDIHIGARNDSRLFADYHISFFEKILFPYMKKNNITHIIQLGDIFDRRKYINFQVLSEWRKRVFNVMKSTGLTMDIIAGNHDVFYKNTNDVNSPTLLLSDYDNLNIFSQTPMEKVYGNTKVLLVPWITANNEKQSFKAMKETNALIAMGHFELNGFEMDKGHVFEGGLDVKKLGKFDTVYSGHFHHRSNNGHVCYTGIPYQITWVDYGSQKGFHIWDSDNLNCTFIPNPDEIFVKFVYDDSSDPENYFKGFNVKGIADKYVKVIVVSKSNLYGFDQFMSKLYHENPGDVKIIEGPIDFDSDVLEQDDLNLDDTVDIMDKYVDSIDVAVDKKKLKTLLKTLFIESTHMEAA